MQVVTIPDGQGDVVLSGHHTDTEWLIRERPQGRRRRLYVRGVYTDCLIRNLSGFDHADVKATFIGTRAQRGLGYSHWRNGPFSKVDLTFVNGTPFWFAGLNEGPQYIRCHSYRLGYDCYGNDLLAGESGMWLQGKIDTGGKDAVYLLDIKDRDSVPFVPGYVRAVYRYGVVVEASPGPTLNVHARFDCPHWEPIFDVKEVERYDRSPNPNLVNEGHSATGVVKRLQGANVNRYNLMETGQ